MSCVRHFYLSLPHKELEAVQEKFGSISLLCFSFRLLLVVDILLHFLKLYQNVCFLLEAGKSNRMLPVPARSQGGSSCHIIARRSEWECMGETVHNSGLFVCCKATDTTIRADLTFIAFSNPSYPLKASLTTSRFGDSVPHTRTFGS